MVYNCSRCKGSFNIGRSVRFVKTSMPVCPYCGSSEIELAKEELNKRERVDTQK